MQLSSLLQEERVTTTLSAATKHDALSAIAALFAQGDDGQTLDADRVLRVLEDREKLASTGVGSGVAIPHGRMPELDQLKLAVAISRDGIPFDAIDGEPVRILVAVLAPQRQTGDHLKVLARVSRLLRSEAVRARLLGANDAAGAMDVVVAEDRP